MDANGRSGCGCGCEGCGADPCECGSAEFVRLRYYYGQRLGALDFSDAQAYGVGKQRFHNLRAHGAGVLCGLEARREVFPQGAPATDPTTILRVTRGAALDGCGREVIVPGDQCIDVAAWFARHRERLGLTSWGADAPRTLWVGLRYRECPSDPAPAPRDPCGCDAGGCEFGRVREGFELALLHEEPACAGATFPPGEALQALIAGLAGGSGEATAAERFRRALVPLLAGHCPPPEGDAWLCLASFPVTLAATDSGPPVVKDIGPPDLAIPGRAPLLTTAALQALVAGLAATSADEGLGGPGPRLGALSFAPGADATSGELTVEVELVVEGDPPAPVALAADTFRPEHVAVWRFEAGTWKEAPPTEVAYDPARGIVLRWKSGTLADGRYRVAIDPPWETPIVDDSMRPLRPARFARAIRLVASGPALGLADTLF